MTSFKFLCEKYFGCSNFYEILKVDHDATEKQLKKAYHRLSLLFHPDRVEEDQKVIATEKFKALGRIHSILQNPEKRRLYDDVGEYNDETEDSMFNWLEYWRTMFKKIELEDIEKYEKEYIGSETELRDIKRAYVSGKGNMDKILEMVAFSNCDSEPRFIEIIQKMVDDGEVEYYKAFFKESKQKKLRRHKKWEKEKNETEQINMKELEKEMELNMKKRASSFANLMSNLESTYAPKRKRMSIAEGGTKEKNKKPSTK